MASESVTKQIIIAGVTAAVTTAVAVIITNWLTKEATIKSVASGETPLPKGSTPTTSSSTPIVATPTPQSQPQPTPPTPSPAPTAQIDISKLSQIANAVATAIPKQPCPAGYHSVPTGIPNFPYMCIQD